MIAPRWTKTTCVGHQWCSGSWDAAVYCVQAHEEALLLEFHKLYDEHRRTCCFPSNHLVQPLDVLDGRFSQRPDSSSECIQVSMLPSSSVPTLMAILQQRTAFHPEPGTGSIVVLGTANSGPDRSVKKEHSGHRVDLPGVVSLSSTCFNHMVKDEFGTRHQAIASCADLFYFLLSSA